MTTKKRWTVPEDDKLLDGRTAGRTIPEIAADLGRTVKGTESRLAWLRERGQTSTASQLAATVQASPAIAPLPPAELEPLPPDELEPLPPDAPEPLPPDAPEPLLPEPTTTWVPWTYTDESRLAAMCRQGLATRDIAAALGRTETAVIGRRSLLKARGADIPSLRPRTSWTPERLADARAMRDAGMTYHQIARRVRAEATTVRRALATSEGTPLDEATRHRPTTDLDHAAREVEQAQAALDRARARYDEALEPLLDAVREAILRSCLVVDPTDECGGPEGGTARKLIDQLRRQGIELRRAA